MYLSTVLLIFTLLGFQKSPEVAISLNGNPITGLEISIASLQPGEMSFTIKNGKKLFKDEPFSFDFTLARDKKAVVFVDHHNLKDSFNVVEVVKAKNNDIKVGDRFLLLFHNIDTDATMMYQFTVVK